MRDYWFESLIEWLQDLQGGIHHGGVADHCHPLDFYLVICWVICPTWGIGKKGGSEPLWLKTLISWYFWGSAECLLCMACWWWECPWPKWPSEWAVKLLAFYINHFRNKYQQLLRLNCSRTFWTITRHIICTGTLGPWIRNGPMHFCIMLVHHVM